MKMNDIFNCTQPKKREIKGFRNWSVEHPQATIDYATGRYYFPNVTLRQARQMVREKVFTDPRSKFAMSFLINIEKQ